jgi:hypothetical protein
MGRHDPDLVAHCIHLALDLDLEVGEFRRQTFEIADPAGFGRQDLVHEFVQGLFCLTAEPGQEPSLQIVLTEQSAIELKRPLVLCQAEDRHQKAMGQVPVCALAGPVLQGGPQTEFSAMSQVKQGLVGQVTEGTAQQSRQGQVVVGKPAEPGQGQEVVENDVPGQGQTVGTGHRDACLFQSPQNLAEDA